MKNIKQRIKDKLAEDTEENPFSNESAEYSEGWQAYQDGVPFDMNPYSPKLQEGQDWEDGWQASADEDNA
jgi:hypothetical protein